MNCVKSFTYYWYMRYLLVTELFMVEKWERRMFYIVALLLLGVLTVINNFLLVGAINLIRQLFTVQNTTDILHNIDRHAVDETF